MRTHPHRRKQNQASRISARLIFLHFNAGKLIKQSDAHTNTKQNISPRYASVTGAHCPFAGDSDWGNGFPARANPEPQLVVVTVASMAADPTIPVSPLPFPPSLLFPPSPFRPLLAALLAVAAAAVVVLTAVEVAGVPSVLP